MPPTKLSKRKMVFRVELDVYATRDEDYKEAEEGLLTEISLSLKEKFTLTNEGSIKAVAFCRGVRRLAR